MITKLILSVNPTGSSEPQGIVFYLYALVKIRATDLYGYLQWRVRKRTCEMNRKVHVIKELTAQ